MKPALRVVALGAALAGQGALADDGSAWEKSYDAATRTRFIPVELQRADHWGGEQVYESINRGKRQLFGLREDKTGLGRVFDSRYPRSVCKGEVKFPLGLWKQGEVREPYREGRGRGTDMRYVYSPLRGLVSVEGEE